LRRAKRILVVAALASVVLTGGLIALPWTHDMDNQLTVKPQEMPVPPPEFSVPTTGREFAKSLAVEATYKNPQPADSASLARGSALFAIYCTPCHGARGEGMGAVVRKGFMPPPVLTGPLTRGRTDGYLYSYLRHGGAVMMPTYGFALRPPDAWDVVNHVRRLQAESPTP
jgi:mono/diheme cytochrome c family protein